ncbi:MAG: DNA polymerase I [Elusimicrobiota bacterium]
MREIYLIDGNAYIHRAYHALPKLVTSKGQEVGAVFGFIKMVVKLWRDGAEQVVVCFDSPGKTFRHEKFSAYKATRKEAETALVLQIPITHKVVELMNIPSIALPGYEADDIIATLAGMYSKNGDKVVIVTGDKDLAQVVNDKISILNTHKGVVIDRGKVGELYAGLVPEQLVDMFALAGDKVDNVPGVAGVGDVTALKLIHEFGSLDNLYSKIGNVKGKLKEKLELHKSDAYLSRELVTLNSNVPLEDPLVSSSGVNAKHTGEETEAYLRELEFHSLFNDEVFTKKVKLGDIRRSVAVEVEAVQSVAEFERIAAGLMSQKCVSLALEVQDIVGKKLVACAGLADAQGRCYYVNLNGYIGGDYDRCIKVLNDILENTRVMKVVYGYKALLSGIKNAGISVKLPVTDVLIAAYLLDIGKLSLSSESYGWEELFFKIKGVRPAEKLEAVVNNAYCSMELYNAFTGDIERHGIGKLLSEVEVPLVPVIIAMEDNGVKVNKAKLYELKSEYEKELKKNETEIYALAGEKFNVNSPKQLGVVLFEKLNLQGGKRTKSGYSTDEDVLNRLSAVHALPQKVLEYRERQKLKSTYIDVMLELADAGSRVHTTFNQIGTTTGRLSSVNPNLQNIPVRSVLGKKIRSVFIAQDGWRLLSADYSQIDLRVLAHMSGDENLVQSFIAGKDIHSRTAAEIFGVTDESMVDEAQRRVAKTINFGIVYGISAFGLAQQLGIEIKLAGEYIEKYMSKYAGVKAWRDRVIKEAKVSGYVKTLFNHLRHVQDINATNNTRRGFAERIAMNTPIQGTAAEIIKLAMVKIDNRRKVEHWESRMLLQVHDELVFECTEAELGSVKDVVVAEMSSAVKLNVPLVVDVKVGDNWVDMDKI